MKVRTIMMIKNKLRLLKQYWTTIATQTKKGQIFWGAKKIKSSSLKDCDDEDDDGDCRVKRQWFTLDPTLTVHEDHH